MPLSSSKTETIVDPVVTVSSPAPEAHSASISLRSALKWILVLLPFAYLWFRLIDNLHLEWETNPQYSYGYLVPLLCLGLIVRRWGDHGKAESERQKAEFSAFSFQHFSFFFLFAFFAFLYLPTRLIEASTPEWRPIQWLLGMEAVGLTLCAIELGRGRGWLRQMAFPILFFLVAVPWPSLIEQPIIQGLTRLSAAIVIEALGWVGIPAMAHGNVIQVATGTVGIDEACSGIRSFQSSIMISLFLGEFYRLGWGRRLLLLVAGFVFSFGFNIFRMGLLTWIAAREGVPAIGKYHDPAGVTIAIACTLVLWAFAAILKSRANKQLKKNAEHRISTSTSQSDSASPNPDSPICAPHSDLPTPNSQLPSPISELRTSVFAPEAPATTIVNHRSSIINSPRAPHSAFNTPLAPTGGEGQGEGASPFNGRDEQTQDRIQASGLSSQHSKGKRCNSISAFSFQFSAFALLSWLVAVELGVAGWYHHVEAGLKPSKDWTVQFPTTDATYQDLPIADTTRGLLRFDDGHQGAWTDTNGVHWSVFYFNWLPGRVAGYLAKRHTPEICLPAAGCQLRSGPHLEIMNINGVELPIRSYLFQSENGSLHVYHCRWEAGVSSDAYVTHESGRFNLIRGIWNGRGDRGQKILEIIVTGLDDPVQLKAALTRQLEQLIQVQNTSAK